MFLTAPGLRCNTLKKHQLLGFVPDQHSDLLSAEFLQFFIGVDHPCSTSGLYVPPTIRDPYSPHPAASSATVGFLSEQTQASSSSVTEDEVSTKRWWQFGSTKATVKPIIATIAADNSTVVLPSPPTDEEKTIYTQTRRYVTFI
jgi:hypothetical protein